MITDTKLPVGEKHMSGHAKHTGKLARYAIQTKSGAKK